MLYTSFLFLYFIACAYSQHLPKYIKPCRISDPEINQCLVANGNEALQVIFKGDKYFQIAPFSPVWIVPKIGGLLSKNFKYSQTNTKISKFDTLKLTNATYNKEENSLFFRAEMPIVPYTANYDMDIQFLGKRIFGRGGMSGSIEKVVYAIKIFLKTVARSHFNYYAVEKSSFNIEVAKATFKFNKLYSGDNIKGKEANELINGNWHEFSEHIEPYWSNFFNGFTPKLLDKFMRMVPKDQFLLP